MVFSKGPKLWNQLYSQESQSLQENELVKLNQYIILNPNQTLDRIVHHQQFNSHRIWSPKFQLVENSKGHQIYTFPQITQCICKLIKSNSTWYSECTRIYLLCYQINIHNLTIMMWYLYGLKINTLFLKTKSFINFTYTAFQARQSLTKWLKHNKEFAK